MWLTENKNGNGTAEVLFIQEVSGAYTSPFLDTDELKMALWARKVSGTFEKRASDLYYASLIFIFCSGKKKTNKRKDA